MILVRLGMGYVPNSLEIMGVCASQLSSYEYNSTESNFVAIKTISATLYITLL